MVGLTNKEMRDIRDSARKGLKTPNEARVATPNEQEREIAYTRGPASEIIT